MNSNQKSFWVRLLNVVGAVLTAIVEQATSGSRRHTGAAGSVSAEKPKKTTATVSSGDVEYDEVMPGEEGDSRTIEVDPDRIKNFTLVYGPVKNGSPDGGEVVWTWVPYEENDGRGKDRPVLVIGEHSTDRVYAVKMTSKSHSGDSALISVGSGPWDSQGRESFVDVDQLYSVHSDGARREASALSQQKFEVVAKQLRQRYGWK